MKSITLLLALTLIMSLQAQLQGFLGYSLTQGNPLIVTHIEMGDFGVYSRVSGGNERNDELSFKLLSIGTGISYDLCRNEKVTGRITLGVSINEYWGIQGNSYMFNVDNLNTFSLDSGVIFDIPGTKRWYGYVNNDWINWVLEVGVGISLTRKKSSMIIKKSCSAYKY